MQGGREQLQRGGEGGDPCRQLQHEAEFGAQRSDNELKCINLNNQHLSASNNNNNNNKLLHAFGDNNSSNNKLLDHDLQKPATLEGSLHSSSNM